MKRATLALAIVLVSLAAPALARDITGDDAPSFANRRTLPHYSQVTVFSVSNDSAILLHRDPDLGMDPVIAAAIMRAGYTGLQIIGYQLDGTSLTVYLKS